MTDFKSLQSGSCITGLAAAAGDGSEAELSRETAGQISGAFCYLLAKKVHKNPMMLNICVGQDARPSCAELKEGVIEAVNVWGAQAFDAGLTVTPAMAMAARLPQLEFDGAVMITGSHLAPEYNGFRFFSPAGSFDEDDVTELLRLAGRYAFIGGAGDKQETNAQQIYSAYLRQTLSQGLADVPGYLKGMHIVVDAGNGTAGFFAKEVLERMGADISGSIFLEPDGSFPNHPADTQDSEAVESICRAVRVNNADLGILFDGDGSSITVAAPGGIPVICDEMTAPAADTSGHEACSDSSSFDDGMLQALQTVINAARLKRDGKDIRTLIK